MCQYPVLSTTPSPSRWSQANVDLIEDSAADLLDVNGNTTNLEIKEYLRSDGYWMLQKDVSWAMTWLCEQNSWYAIMDPTNTYRIYYPDYASAENALLHQSPAVSTNGDTDNSSRPDKKDTPRHRFGDWELFVYGDDQGTYPTVTLRGMWRNEARNQYSLDFGVSYSKIAANKAK